MMPKLYETKFDDVMNLTIQFITINFIFNIV